MTSPVLIIAEMAAATVEVRTLRDKIDSFMKADESSVLEKGDDYFGLS